MRVFCGLAGGTRSRRRHHRRSQNLSPYERHNEEEQEEEKVGIFAMLGNSAQPPVVTSECSVEYDRLRKTAHHGRVMAYECSPLRK